jgi:hypothetical protein
MRRIAMQLSRIAMGATLVFVVACSKQGSLGDDNNNGSGPAAGPDNTLVVANANEQTTAHNYSCAPINYRAAGNVLVGLGVVLKIDPLEVPLPSPTMTNNNNNNTPTDPNAPAPGAAQTAYTAAKSSFGVADYINRNPEATTVGTAQLAKMGDLFVQAAPEILAGFAASPRCGGVQLFDGDGHLSREGMTCLGGQVASTDQVTLANQLLDRAVAQGMTQEGARELVVAGYLSAQFTCR